MEYVRNGLRELVPVIGPERSMEIGKRAARLTGLQQYHHMAQAMGCVDGNVADAATFLRKAFSGMGDEVDFAIASDGLSAVVTQTGLRIVRGIEGEDRKRLLSCWIELWRGAIASHRAFFDVDVQEGRDNLSWELTKER